jgi:hypothetical protein
MHAVRAPREIHIQIHIRSLTAQSACMFLAVSTKPADVKIMPRIRTGLKIDDDNTAYETTA